MKNLTPVKFVILSQACLYVFLAICTVLMPQYAFSHNEGGVSNYGTHLLTVVPYTLAFGLGGGLLLVAGRTLKIRSERQRMFRKIVYVVGVLLLLVLLSTYPYKLNEVLDDLHIVIAQILFVAELLSAIWLALIMYKDKINTSLFVIQLFGSILAVLTLIGLLHILFIAQAIAGLAFALLFIRSAFYLQVMHRDSSKTNN